jgi:hypothetical protein
MPDKKITELPIASALNLSDVSILVSSGTNYQYAFTTLLQLIGDNLNVGANLSFGTTLPSNTLGNNGDVFIKTNTGAFAQKIAGVWTIVYTLPTTSGITDGTVLYGLGIPGSGAGNNNDTYINTGTGIFYKKTAGTWAQVFSMQSGPQGPQGTAGTNGTNGTNGFSVLNGSTNPSNLSTGTNGDFYINTSNYTFFGPKTTGGWGDGVSLVPPGVIVGGCAGQALIKASDDDYDTQWLDLDTKYVNLADAGQANGYAPLNSAIKVDASYLPSYVSDIVTVNNYAGLPFPGTAGFIYITADDNKEYRWNEGTTAYIELVPSPGTTDALAEGTENLYYKDERVVVFSDARYQPLEDQRLSSNNAPIFQQLYLDNAGFVSIDNGLPGDLNTNFKYRSFGLAYITGAGKQWVIIDPTQSGDPDNFHIGGDFGTIFNNRLQASSAPVNDSDVVRLTDLSAYEQVSNKGIANGYTPLNSATKIDASYLPSYISDIVTVTTYPELPSPGTPALSI